MAQEGKPVERVKTVDEYHEQTPRRWPMLLLYLFIALIVAVVLVFGARAIYRHYHNKHVKTAADTSQTARPGSSSDSSGVSVSTGSGSGSSSSSSGSKNSSSSTSNSNLPNSGPGQVAGLFIGATLAGASVHYIVSSQRRSKTN